MTGNWRHLRAEFALEGIDWRSWTVADRAAVAYLMLQRWNAGDNQALRELYLLVGDKAKVAALDRQILGQSETIVTDR